MRKTQKQRRKKKVLYVITKSNFGGAQRYLYDLAHNLPKDQFDVKVALGGTGGRGAKTGTLEEKLTASGIPTIRIQNFMRDMSILQDIKVFFELFQIVRKEKPDALHVTSSKAGGIGTLVGRLTRTKVIIFTSHGLAFDESWRPQWQRVLIWVASWFTFLFSTQTIQITKDTYTRAQNMPFMGNRHTLIYNGREMPDFVKKESAREKLGATASAKDSLWIGAFSELTKNKNLHVLIDALALIHKKGHSPHLFICGEGEERHFLEQKTKDCGLEQYVHFKGFVQDAAIYISAFDIFTLPSTKEGLPYVLIEAGLAKLPVVVSNIPGIRDIVTHGQSGLMVEITASAIADALLLLLEDTTLREQYGENLYSHVSKVFSIDKMVKETMTLY